MARSDRGSPGEEKLAPDDESPGAERGWIPSLSLPLALPLAAGLCSLVAYVSTLSPIAGPGDSPELAAAVATGGVPHPTGYPLYIILGHLWSQWVPVGDMAWRVNLFSAVLGAGAIAAIAVMLRRMFQSAEAAWFGAMLFAFAPVFWAECTVTEVYALHMVFMALILWLWLRWEESGERRWLLWTSFAVGLSFTHHLMTLLLLPLLGAVLLLRWKQWWSPGTLASMVALTLLPLSLYLYLPWAASGDPGVAWGGVTDPGRFFIHITGGIFHRILGGSGDSATLQKLARYPGGMLKQFSVFGILVVGGIWSLRGDWRKLVALGLGFAGSLAFSVSYDVIDPDPFYLPSVLFVVIWIAGGAALMLQLAREHAAKTLPWLRGALLLAPLVPLLGNYASQDRSDWYRLYDLMMSSLAAVPDDATLLLWGHNGRLPLYASIVEGVRPELPVVDLFLLVRGNYGPELERIRWDEDLSAHEQIAETLKAARRLGGSQRELYALPLNAGSGWADFGYSVLEGGAVHRLVPGVPDLRVETHPESERVHAFANGVELLAVETSSTRVRQGEVLFVDYYWRLSRAQGGIPPEVFVQLGDARGVPAPGESLFEERHALGQGAPLSGYAANDVIRERLAVAIPYELDPGQLTLWLGLRTRSGMVPLRDGGLFAAVGEIELRDGERRMWELPAVHRPRSDHRLSYHPMSAAYSPE